MTHKFKDNIVHYAINTIIAFIILSSALSFWNRYVTYDTRSIIDKTELVKSLTLSIHHDLIKNVDLSLHAYANTGNTDKLVLFNQVVADKDSVFDLLEQNLNYQQFEISKLKDVRNSFDQYLTNAHNIIALIHKGDTTEYKTLLNNMDFLNNGLYKDFKESVIKAENQIEEQARSDYDWSITDNAIIQIILIFLSIPILIIASKKLSNEVKNNKKLLVELNENNKKYLYDDGETSDITANAVVSKSIHTFKKAFDFVENVSKGNYGLGSSLLTAKELPLNEKTLMGALLKMSDKLQKSEEEERKRQWVANGLNRFYEIVRNNQDNPDVLADKAVVFLTKYLDSQQGSLFLYHKTETDAYLVLAACYAYDRKKWIDQRIEIGEGLVGQAFLEIEPTILTNIPSDYMSITSGMGDATPTSLLIVPFTYNDKVEAVFEVAGFVLYEPIHVEFLKKAGEFLASALQNAKNTLEMKALFDSSLEQTEILKAQEEELRQNMEELEATNESIRNTEKNKLG